MYEEPLKRIASELGPDKSLLLLGSIVFAILFIIFGFGGAVDDVCVFYDYSQKLGAGLPYRDYSLGYPPLSLVIFAIPGLFTDDLYTYSVIFYAITTLFFIGGNQSYSSEFISFEVRKSFGVNLRIKNFRLSFTCKIYIKWVFCNSK